LKTMRLEDKLFLDGFKPDEESHLAIKDMRLCREQCKKRPCLEVCPANVYRWEGERVTISYEACLECGTCRISCPDDNIDWRFPRGGYGIGHKFG